MTDYPSEQVLSFIKNYDTCKGPIEDLFDFIIQEWNWPDWGTKKKGRKYEFHTGGWSGNEDIIRAMQDNYLFWGLCWVMSKRGGHYWFEIPIKLTKRCRIKGKDNDNQK